MSSYISLEATRRQTMVKRRYSEFTKFPVTKRPSSLRSVLPGIGESKRELNFTLAEGLAWKVGVRSSFKLSQIKLPEKNAIVNVSLLYVLYCTEYSKKLFFFFFCLQKV